MSWHVHYFEIRHYYYWTVQLYYSPTTLTLRYFEFACLLFHGTCFRKKLFFFTHLPLTLVVAIKGPAAQLCVAQAAHTVVAFSYIPYLAYDRIIHNMTQRLDSSQFDYSPLIHTVYKRQYHSMPLRFLYCLSKQSHLLQLWIMTRVCVYNHRRRLHILPGIRFFW